MNKEQIDALSYEEILRLWRFHPVGDPMFQGDDGEYLVKTFYRKKAEISSEEHTAISKRVGWEEPNGK